MDGLGTLNLGVGGGVVHYCSMYITTCTVGVWNAYMYLPLPPPYLYDQAEKDRAKALEHELEGARAIIEVAIDHFMVWNLEVLSLVYKC